MSTQNVKEHLDDVIDSRINEARKLLFKIDFWSSVLLLSVFLAVVLFVAIVADQWLFTGGLSVTLRLGVSAAMLAVSVFFVYRRILPLFLYPINPVYAAHILDDNSASAKNSIINWITLKRERIERGRIATDKLGEKIFEGLTRTAAESVNAVPAERIINRNGINICLIALGIIVAVLFVYFCFSPKNPVQSFARIILPFASIEPPQATKFLDIEPRNITALQGEHLTVSAKVVGKSKSPVYVFFSTDDGRVVKQAVPMNKLTDDSGGGFWGRSEGVRFETPFPPGKQGFVCGTDYWIQQDESKSNTYRVEVRPVATVEIESLTYKYPNYTGLADEVVNNTGDIRAVSGTEVIVSARSTIPLAEAEIVYDKNSSTNNTSTNLPRIKMQIDKNNPTAASANISLKNDTPIDPNSNNTNEIVNHFTITATDTDGFKSRRSGIFRQEVTRDKPPLVQWSDTAAELKEVAQIDLPLNAEIELSLQAEDPDFALRYLRINYKVTSDKKVNWQIKPSELLQSHATNPTEHKGQIKKSVNFPPLQHKLGVGDTVEVWGEAVDTKLPIKNTAETRHITIRITEQQKNTGKNKPNEKDKQTDPKEPSKTQEDKKEDKKNNPDQPDKQNQPNEKNKTDERSENQQSEEKQKGNDPNENNPKGNEMSNQQKGEQQGDNTSENKGGNNEKTSKETGNPQDTENTAPDGEKSEQNNGNNKGAESKNNESKKPIDPETESADAMQKIVDQMNKDKWQSKSEPDKNNSNDPNQQDKNSEAQKQKNDQVEKSKPEENQNKTEKQKNKNNEKNPDEKNGKGENKEGGEKSEQNNNDGKGEKGNGTKSDKNDDKQNQPNSENSANDKTSNQQSQTGNSPADKKTQDNKPEPTTNNPDKTSEQNGDGDNTNAENSRNNQTEKSDNKQNNNSDPNSTSEPDNSAVNNDNTKQNNDQNQGQSKGQGQQGNQTDNPNTQNNTAKNSSDADKRTGADEVDDTKSNDKNNTQTDNSDNGKNTTGKNNKVDPNKTNDGVSKNNDQENKVTKSKEQPVDPNDDAKRSRGDVEPKSDNLREKGSDATNPQKTDLDRENESRLNKNEAKESTTKTVDKQQSKPQQKPSTNSDSEANDGKNGSENSSKNGGQDKTSQDESSGGESENNLDGKSGGKKDGSKQGAGKSSSSSNGNPDGNSEGNTENDSPKGSANDSANNSPTGKPTNDQNSGKNKGSASGGTGRDGIGGSNGSIDSEAARREFTEKNVNLALDYLEDQLDKGKPSEELLNELGWTENQLREFHKKWKTMSENAKRNETTKPNEVWENALKSFGIMQPSESKTTLRNQTTIKDNTKKVQSTNLTPPSNLQKRFIEYTKGIGK
ncbi:MAG: hypothetical protein LBK06_07425 [Planctomycetaceae bacterium]|jgi:hypothetical protein|nr:hypothetical protein [Planctomycetaceae bacterium]